MGRTAVRRLLRRVMSGWAVVNVPVRVAGGERRGRWDANGVSGFAMGAER